MVGFFHTPPVATVPLGDQNGLKGKCLEDSKPVPLRSSPILWLVLGAEDRKLNAEVGKRATQPAYRDDQGNGDRRTDQTAHSATNGLRPGDCLPGESDLCDSLGVSRSSLREAVRTLSTLEIVEVQDGRGTFVGNATLRPLVETLAFHMNMLSGKHQHALREVVEVRRGIDLGEAKQVCFTLRGTGDEELHQLVDRITEATGRESPSRTWSRPSGMSRP